MHHQISIKPLRQHLRAAILAVSIGSVAAMPAFAAEPNAALHEYHIPAGPLSQVLSRFAAEAGILLSADAALADGKASPGLNGQYSIENGFEILLKDSGLVVHRHGQKRYSITAKPEQGNALPEVEVKTRTDSLAFSEEYSGGQVARVGNVGLLGNKDFMETPFSTISYTEEAIANRQSGNVMNIISQTDPSVNIIGSAENSGYYLRTSLRGFSTTSASYGFNGLYGLGSYQSSFTSAFAERVEVLKGPSALLNGMLTDGSVGGAINIVTKRAADAPLTRLTAGYESDSIWKTHLDVGRRFGENNEWGVRFNAIKEQGDATTKYKERNNDAYALALDYRGDRLRLSADIFQYKTHITGDNGSITLANTTTKVPSAPQHGRLIGGEPWASMDDKNTGGMFKAEFDLTKKTSAWISAGYNRSNPDQIGVAGWMILTPRETIQSHAQ
ncbi:TonB-dependent receptor plug domain-containing protein [Methylobacillus sp. Pita1]|uniref:TonB-dependent siderophore receptor n=1 Tax=Methylobacillus sp. Pita1 TaxID=3382642 RepID=UPI0038B5140A